MAKEISPRLTFERAVHAYVRELRASGAPPEHVARMLALGAKECIFRAQDAAGSIEDILGDDLRPALVDVRHSLEAIDRMCRARAAERRA